VLEKRVKVEGDNGNETHFGVPVCEGPKTYRLLVTWPYDLVGEIVEIPLDRVESISDIQSGRMGAEPEVVDGTRP